MQGVTPRVRAKSLQSCLTLCDPKGRNPPGSSVHGILPTRILERVAISSSRASSQPRDGSNPCLLCLLLWQAGSFPGGPYLHGGNQPTLHDRTFPAEDLLLAVASAEFMPRQVLSEHFPCPGLLNTWDGAMRWRLRVTSPCGIERRRDPSSAATWARFPSW